MSPMKSNTHTATPLYTTVLIETAAASSNATSRQTKVGPIIGGVVAGLVVFAISLYLTLRFYIRRRLSAERQADVDAAMVRMGLDIKEKEAEENGTKGSVLPPGSGGDAATGEAAWPSIEPRYHVQRPKAIIPIFHHKKDAPVDKGKAVEATTAAPPADPTPATVKSANKTSPGQSSETRA